MKILKALIVLGLAIVIIVSVAGFLFVQIRALQYLLVNMNHLTAIDYFLGTVVTTTFMGLGCTGLKAIK